MFIIFPNVSFSGSGCGLQTGDKVYLGRFEAGTSLAWFLIPNGFNDSNASLTITSQIKHSIHSLNDYNSEPYQQHTILLNDIERELLLLGFEDTTRPGGDNDFNDAIFFVSANPYRAVNTTDILPIKQAIDTDGDGKFDHEDDFPNDPERAFKTYYPSINSQSTFLFEDLWPATGDYDFNDLVADLHICFIKDAQNRTKELTLNWTLKAIGGYQQNGLLVQLPINPEKIESVKGSEKFDYYINLSTNGTEFGTETAVFIISDNLSKSLPPPSGYKITNVLDEQPYVIPRTISKR